MLVRYDAEVDALYVKLREGKSKRTKELDSFGNRMVDYDAQGNVLGVEFLFASRGIDLEGVPCAELVSEALHGVPHPVGPRSLGVHYDSEADAIEVTLRDGTPERTREIDENRSIDIDADGNVLSVEFLFVSKGIDLTGVPHSDLVGEALRRVPHPVA